MKKLLFTFPGKAGDNLLRLPVAYQYCKQNNIKTEICLDAESKFLVNLFEKQRWVDRVFIDDGVWDYSYGGQPYDFRKDQEFKEQYERVFHLGFVSNCYGQIMNFNNDENFRRKYNEIIPISYDKKLLNTTLVSAIQSECGIDLKNLLSESSIEFNKKELKNICIHIDTATPERRIESKEAISKIYDKLLNIFDKIFIINKTLDREEYLSFLNNDKTEILDDGGDLNKTVDVLASSILIGTYGSMWALANCMKIKQVVVMNDWDICEGKKSYDEEKWVNAKDTVMLLETITKLKG